MDVRDEEDGRSEGHSVMEWIGVAPAGNITPRESALTSIWSFITRDLGQPLQERKQMTTVVTLIGALSDSPVAWHAIKWYAVHRNVRRLQARIVKAVQAVGRCTTALNTERLKGSSCLKGNFHEQFLGGLAGVIPPGYPASDSDTTSLLNHVIIVARSHMGGSVPLRHPYRIADQQL
jgi:hypothetical protein